MRIFYRLSRAALCNLVGGIVLTLFTSFIFFFNLAETSIDQGSDEVVYARVTQTLSSAWDRGDSGFPLKHGSLPFYEKPPLKFILSAVALKIFGNSTFGLRALDGALGCLSVLLSVLLIRKITYSLPIGLVTGFLVQLVPEWVLFAHSFRRNVLDGLLVTLILFASFWSWKGYQELCYGRSPRRSFAIFSAICGVATLVKSVAGLVPLFPLLVLIVLQPSSVKEKGKSIISCAAGPLIFCGYCLLLYLTLPKALHIFIGTEILHRVTSGFDGHNVGEPFFYFNYLFNRAAFLPLGFLVVGLFGLGSLLKVGYAENRLNPEGDLSTARIGIRYLLIMAWCPILLFSLSSAKLPWYISPYAPFFIGGAVFGSVLIFRALIVRAWLSKKKSLQRGFLVFALFILCLPLIPRTERVVRFVVSSTHRLPIDIVVEKIAAEDGGVIIVDNVISSRTTPIKGRFNVEGIYKEMLQGRVTQASSSQEIHVKAGDVVFVANDIAHTLPYGGIEIARLPPLAPRREEVMVLRY